MSISLLFPGQGSQEPGMGRDIAEQNVQAMDLWKTAERVSGLPLREIYWDSDDVEAMAATHHLQPALTVVNLNLWTYLAAKVKPSCAAGHSLGEYSALAAAGVLPVHAVLELVSLRGRLMREADPDGRGAMAAVLKLSLDEVEACVAEAAAASNEMLVVANYNTPGQFVVSGARAAVAALQDVVRARKGRSLQLPVSGAFHSPLMRDAAAELSTAIDALGKGGWNNARFPVYANATGTGHTAAAELKELLRRQMTSSVRWTDTIGAQWNAGARSFVECGPKGVLTKMVAPILADRAGEDGTAPAFTAQAVGSLAELEAFHG